MLHFLVSYLEGMIEILLFSEVFWYGSLHGCDLSGYLVCEERNDPSSYWNTARIDKDKESTQHVCTAYCSLQDLQHSPMLVLYTCCYQIKILLSLRSASIKPLNIISHTILCLATQVKPESRPLVPRPLTAFHHSHKKQEGLIHDSA